MTTKKSYITPQLEVLGAVSELTQEASSENSDVPVGDPGTAYSPAGISPLDR